FYRGLVSHLQVQREDRARSSAGAGSVPAARRCEIESRLDQWRPGDYEITSTIWPARCPIIRALSGQIGRADCISGIAHAAYLTRQTRNHHNYRRFTISYENQTTSRRIYRSRIRRALCRRCSTGRQRRARLLVARRERQDALL